MCVWFSVCAFRLREDYRPNHSRNNYSTKTNKDALAVSQPFARTVICLIRLLLPLNMANLSAIFRLLSPSFASIGRVHCSIRLHASSCFHGLIACNLNLTISFAIVLSRVFFTVDVVLFGFVSLVTVLSSRRPMWACPWFFVQSRLSPLLPFVRRLALLRWVKSI